MRSVGRRRASPSQRRHSHEQSDTFLHVQRPARSGDRVLHRDVSELRSTQRRPHGQGRSRQPRRVRRWWSLFMGYNGGPYFSFSEGVSLYVDCADQDEVDRYWDKLVKAGAKPTQCGWIKDPFGLSWQIVPRRFTELIRDRDPRKVKAVMEAMMTMVKLDVAELERAYNEA